MNSDGTIVKSISRTKYRYFWNVLYGNFYTLNVVVYSIHLFIFLVICRILSLAISSTKRIVLSISIYNNYLISMIYVILLLVLFLDGLIYFSFVDFLDVCQYSVTHFNMPWKISLLVCPYLQFSFYNHLLCSTITSNEYISWSIFFYIFFVFRRSIWVNNKIDHNRKKTRNILIFNICIQIYVQHVIFIIVFAKKEQKQYCDR